jgi:hypothetical protein
MEKNMPVPSKTTRTLAVLACCIASSAPPTLQAFTPGVCQVPRILGVPDVDPIVATVKINTSNMTKGNPKECSVLDAFEAVTNGENDATTNNCAKFTLTDGKDSIVDI